MDESKLGRRIKEYMIEEVANRLKGSENIFITECGKLTNKELQDLRKRIKKSSGKYMVVKNTMFARVLEKLGIEGINEFINDTCGVGYGSGDPVAVSKALVDYTKENEKFKIKGAYVDGGVILPDSIKELAKIPSREILIARLMASMNSSVNGMVVALSGIVRKFIYALNAIKESKSSKG